MNATTTHNDHLDRLLDAGVPEAALEETQAEELARCDSRVRNPGASYRRFRVHNAGDGYTLHIEECDPTDVYPSYWGKKPHSHGLRGDGAKTREQAWSIARQFRGPVIYTDRDGGRKNLGNLYDPEYVEELAYRGYCADGRSYSDACFFAPVSIEVWRSMGSPERYA